MPGEKLRVHAASLLKECAPEGSFADTEALGNAREIPDVLAGDLGDVDLDSGVELRMGHVLRSGVVRRSLRLRRGRFGAALGDPVRRGVHDNLAVDLELAGADRLVEIVQFDVRPGDGDGRAGIDTGVKVRFEDLRDEVTVRVEGDDLVLVVPCRVVRDLDGRFGVVVVCIQERCRQEMLCEGIPAMGSSPGRWLGSIWPAAAARAR